MMDNKEIAALMRIDRRLRLESTEGARLAWIDNEGGLRLISFIGTPYIGVDGIREPCECAYFVSGGYVCLDSLMPHEFKAVASINSEMRAEEAKG